MISTQSRQQDSCQSASESPWSVLIIKRAKTSLHTKWIVYEPITKPTCETHYVQLWAAAKTSNINKIQTLQTETSRIALNVPRYIPNDTVHNDLHARAIILILLSTNILLS